MHTHTHTHTHIHTTSGVHTYIHMHTSGFQPPVCYSQLIQLRLFGSPKMGVVTLTLSQQSVCCFNLIVFCWEYLCVGAVWNVVWSAYRLVFICVFWLE